MTVARRPVGESPPPIDPEPSPLRPARAGASGPDPFRIEADLLDDALAAGRLPLAALRLTILQALDAELHRRGRSPDERGAHRERIGRFLADHADRRSLPDGEEARRWLRDLERSGRMSEEEAKACLRSLGFLYARVLDRADTTLPAPGVGRLTAAG